MDKFEEYVAVLKEQINLQAQIIENDKKIIENQREMIETYEQLFLIYRATIRRFKEDTSAD